MEKELDQNNDKKISHKEIQDVIKVLKRTHKKSRIVTKDFQKTTMNNDCCKKTYLNSNHNDYYYIYSI